MKTVNLTSQITKLWFRNDGQIYEGEVDQLNERSGFGKVITQSGNVIQGYWKDGVLAEDKQSQIMFSSGDVYFGYVKD